MSGMQMAPLNVPFSRRRQTAAVVLWLLLLPCCLALFIFMLITPPLLPFALGYIVYIMLDSTPQQGGRKVMWLRRLSLWKWLADFFPISLVKTVDLDPKKNYVFGYHPHGIISLGAWSNFATEATHFSQEFKGIDLRLMTLAANFRMPFFREIILHLGICSASRESCDYVLKQGQGNAIMIVVGGAAEALNAHPGTCDLVLVKRFGFVKVALRAGACLVPVFSFGENDIWDQVSTPKDSFIRKYQKWFQKIASFSPPLLHGRGIFTYNMGILPYRRRIVSVVGKPIQCPKIDNPTLEETQTFHKLYMEGLQELYNTHKDTYAPDRKSDLNFVDE
ncbi:hypothetical protein BATDEDRAFT_92838 [Batrachochytrium dendrobatidis JAM81]|uniref:Diacylglycerol O-acyltransferase n=1 Tax=Batrachochytrium dendrobatidis (strain JAM81 / FGSC 10211) TaxID=684364 RepID=F4PEL5_BATDJ|nr:uncharacterized protein BATDEDRAFT_92838 [Batrachochytrium dendrobatidis JAM81]EGF76324.1 hypothetical protein BATDEDRAFT_92838 [Batrachochytrium dendrobatidis JAM81]KAJ8323673.1 diacylglycerol O-acyltransferase 1 [Batrachochytrium dendrobatidis]KAK5666407.1 diacylglycerol O-acyltransferase 1 [Batrachochytrium dendrobatidis]|eukprot:XP_006683118.1 hypothetical protein BATDEDRAFT_92838 [Batrachochytrium dendrobatidis JAM81]